MRAHTKSMYQRNKRAVIDPIPVMEKFCRGAPIGAVNQAPFFFASRLILKIDEKCPNKVGLPHHSMRLVKRSGTEVSDLSEVPGLFGKSFFKGSKAGVLVFDICADQVLAQQVCICEASTKQ